MSTATLSSLRSLRVRDAAGEGSIDEIALADNRTYVARVFPMERSIYLRGWAVDARARTLASEVRIIVDGSVEVTAAYGHSRNDIANVFGSAELTKCGFEATIPPIFGPGDHGVEAYALSADGTECFCVASLTLHVVSTLVPRAYTKETTGWALGEIEHFANDDDDRTERERAGRFEVTIGSGCIISGWAYDRTTRKTLVEVAAVIDGRWHLQGSPGIERKEISAAHRVDSLPGWGFVVRFALNFVEAGVHSAQIVGRLPNGTWVTVGGAANFEAIASPLPWIWALTKLSEETSWNIDVAHYYSREKLAAPAPIPVAPAIEAGSAFFLSGWAIDKPAMSPAFAVYFSIDGDRSQPIPARYGQTTPSLPAKLGTGPWSHCGFTVLVPTEHLSVGEHSIEVLIVSRNGIGYYAASAMRFRVAKPDRMDESYDRPVSLIHATSAKT